MFVLYLLCKSLIKYAYYIYGFQPKLRGKPTPKDKKQIPILEEIQEGSEEDDAKTPSGFEKDLD